MIIGNYQVRDIPGKPDKVWINPVFDSECGEGGAFSEDALMAALQAGADDLPTAIDRFYRENF